VPARRPHRRRAAFVSIAVAVIALAAWLSARPLLRGLGVAPPDVVLVRASMAGFQPPLIYAKAGEPIRLRLESLDTRFHRDGGGRHQFAIDELGLNVIAPPMGTSATTFVVDVPGTYRFYCSICCGGKANPAMWGTLVVEA